MKKRPPFNQEMAIRGANRRLFARSPLVREKLEESRQEFPRYKKDGTRARKNWVKRQCEACNEWVSTTEIEIDHIDPVVPLEGFPAHLDMWQRIFLFLRRLWCDKSNLQRLCIVCHQKKIAVERYQRMYAQECTQLNIIESSTVTTEDFKKFAKKFTKKRINKYPYPQDFVNRVIALRRKYKMKV